MNDYKFSTLEYKRPDLEARREKLAGWKDAVSMRRAMTRCAR